MPNIIPPEVPGPVPGGEGHFPHHDWLTASVKALDTATGADTGWISGSTGFVAASGYAISSSRYRVFHGIAQVYLRIGHPSGATVAAAPTDSDVVNTDLVTAIPAALIPAYEGVLVGPADASNLSRNLTCVVTPTGKIVLVAMTGTSGWASGVASTIGGTYLVV